MTERFTLISELGRGGMGVVWKARDGETGQIVALKLLRETYAEDPDYVVRFERELELAKRIHSRNVVQVLGYGVREGTPYLALEYVDGPSLRERLATHGPYDWPAARGLLAQIAQGLADAHAAGVVHRDLKPSNVLIGSDGVAKIADFGIAKGLDLTRVTGTSTLLGTPAYLAPEGPEDERSDLYSLGVIGYELLVGAPPFEGKTYQAVILAHVRTQPDLEKLPADARPIISWLLAKDPADRPQRSSDLLPVLWSGAKARAPVVPVTPVAGRAEHQSAPAQAAVTPPDQTPRPVLAIERLSPTSPGPSGQAHVTESSARRSSTPLVGGVGAIILGGCVVAAILAGAILQGSRGSTPEFTPVTGISGVLTNLSSLDSYQFAEITDSSSTVIRGTVINRPSAAFRLDDQGDWIVVGSDGWTTDRRLLPDVEFARWLDPNFARLTEVGKESRNSVSCIHYHGATESVVTDLWVAEDGDYAVGGVFSSPPATVPSFSFSFDILHVNDSANVVTPP